MTSSDFATLPCFPVRSEPQQYINYEILYMREIDQQSRINFFYEIIRGQILAITRLTGGSFLSLYHTTLNSQKRTEFLQTYHDELMSVVENRAVLPSIEMIFLWCLKLFEFRGTIYYCKRLVEYLEKEALSKIEIMIFRKRRVQDDKEHAKKLDDLINGINEYIDRIKEKSKVAMIVTYSDSSFSVDLTHVYETEGKGCKEFFTENKDRLTNVEKALFTIKFARGIISEAEKKVVSSAEILASLREKRENATMSFVRKNWPYLLKMVEIYNYRLNRIEDVVLDIAVRICYEYYNNEEEIENFSVLKKDVLQNINRHFVTRSEAFTLRELKEWLVCCSSGGREEEGVRRSIMDRENVLLDESSCRTVMEAFRIVVMAGIIKREP